MENLPDKHRMWVATVITYSPTYIILAGIAYLCKTWKILSLTAAGIAVLPLLMIPYTFPLLKKYINHSTSEKKLQNKHLIVIEDNS